MKEIETTASTPEELLQILDAQIAARRSHREKASRNRAIILVAGLLIIVVGAAASLLVLDQMLANLRRDDPVRASAPAR